VDKDKRDRYQSDAQAYLEKVSGRYVFDETSGIYKKKTDKHDDNRSTDTTGHYKRFPFWVNVHRDWLALGVSGLTLLLLAGTVHYTRKQWIGMNDTLAEVSKQTIASQQSAEASDRSSLVSQRAERESER
jgi:hypothetical protein